MPKSLPTSQTALQVLKKLFTASDLNYLKSKAQVVLMTGLPGSGKSTISELLGNAYGYWHFSSDQIRMDELFPDQAHRQASEHERVMQIRQLVYQELARRTVQAVKRGQRVVIDSTNLDEKRDLIMASLLEVIKPEKIAFVMVKTPEEIVRKRFNREGMTSAKDWESVYTYWKQYIKDGHAKYPNPDSYPGTKLINVQRYDLETFDWITQIDVLIWDVDQTLYQKNHKISDQIHKYVVTQIQKATHLEWAAAEKVYWQKYKELKSTTLTLDSFGLEGRQLMEDVFASVDFSSYLKPDPKLAKLFKALPQFHHVILTNSAKASTKRKLKALGLDPKIFSAIYTTYDMPYLKPDTRVFEYVIKQTGFAPHQHLFVGDRVETDILPAKAAGMRTALVWKQSDESDVSFDQVYGVGRLFGVEI